MNKCQILRISIRADSTFSVSALPGKKIPNRYALSPVNTIRKADSFMRIQENFVLIKYISVWGEKKNPSKL